MGIGNPGELYILTYLERQYVKVEPIGGEHKRRDYRCFIDSGNSEDVEGKTDTQIAVTHNLPWEPFRIENDGQRAYISWGYNTSVQRCIFYSPQLLSIYDIRNEDIRRVIWNHIYEKPPQRVIHCVPTITDNDRITFIFTVPIDLLNKAGVLTTVDISEYDLSKSIPMQGKFK